MGNKKAKAILISLGGAPPPVIKSLNEQKPDFICFLVSGESKKEIQTVLNGLEYRCIHHDWIETPSAEGLSETFKVVYDKLEAILEKWEIRYEDLIVDYTGGTKTMSAALVLATVENVSRYSYVGGRERTKNGVGIVVDGKERMLFSDNPWNHMAVAVKKEVCLLFNKGRYASALDAMNKTIPKLSGEALKFFEYIVDAVEGYDLWDRFSHKAALGKISKALGKLKPYSEGTDNRKMKKLVENMEGNKDFLSQLVNDKEEQDHFKILDLIANAYRRAAEGRYDDAMARLYRSIEACGQFRLKSKYGVDASNAKIKDIPESLRDEYIKKYRNEDEKIQLPLYAVYGLLNALGDESGARFLKNYNGKLKGLLHTRNHSILGHGFLSVKKETFQEMYEMSLSFTGMNEDSLPLFPDFKL